MTNVLEYLEKTAGEMPGKTAVIDPDGSVTYAELLQNARRAGSALTAVTEPGRPVAVCMEKSVAALTALMGVVYAGCFYVFIDPGQAPARFRQILDVCRPACMICDNPDSLRDVAGGVKLLSADELTRCEIREDALALVRRRSADIDPLYCNFTSGSTGVPKGVLICHRSVIDFIGCFPDIFGITEKDVMGNQAPFDFDVSVKDIYSCFKTGATLVLIPKKYFSIVTELLDYLCENKVTTLVWAVSALCLVTQFRGLQYKVPSSVNKVLFSGELMPVKYLLQWQKALPEARFVNLYGPTEITCNCTYYKIERAFSPEEQIPMGRPFPNEKVFLLDEDGSEITAPGKSGEVCVSGTAVGIGYYSNPSQTEKCFVQNPLNPLYPERIYRTGDLACYNADGDLCFAGRRDFQIKFMGHRIELEEIETAINSIPEVTRACCGYDMKHSRIIAFYCGDTEPRELKKSLYALLPEYMIPARFHKLETLPLTPNGKIDRKLLMSMEDTGNEK